MRVPGSTLGEASELQKMLQHSNEVKSSTATTTTAIRRRTATTTAAKTIATAT